MTYEAESSTPYLYREPLSARRFWIHPYVTVLVTLPIASLLGFSLVVYTVNAIFLNIVVALWNPLFWLVAGVIFLSGGGAPAVVTYYMFQWIPQIWDSQGHFIVRLGKILGALIAWYAGTTIIYHTAWSIAFWMGAEHKAAELMSRTPLWLSLFGVVPSPWAF